MQKNTNQLIIYTPSHKKVATINYNMDTQNLKIKVPKNVPTIPTWLLSLGGGILALGVTALTIPLLHKSNFLPALPLKESPKIVDK